MLEFKNKKSKGKRDMELLSNHIDFLKALSPLFSLLSSLLAFATEVLKHLWK